MYNRNLTVHFVGIGGVGMAGIAEILITLGYRISGSDLKHNSLTERLVALGAKIYTGHRVEHIHSGISVLVFSSAVEQDNPELSEARRLHIPCIPRAEMLAELMRMKYGIAVAGSHGKTTTTSLIGHVLESGALDPTVIVGGRLLDEPSGASHGRGEYLVAEADESDGSFRFLRPAISIVTNIDSEHLNHYGSFGALEAAFFDFMSSVPFYGLVVACGDDPVVGKLVKNVKRRALTYGLSPTNEISACGVVIKDRCSQFTLVIRGEDVGLVKLGMPGRHMICNALAAVSVAIELGMPPRQIIEALETFPGVSRRSEVVFDDQGITVIDDYGHHPTEITSTLAAIRAAYLSRSEPGPGKLIVLFQPHRYSRTQQLFAQFVNSFADADEVLITDIYPAGEPAIAGVSGSAIVEAMRHGAAVYVSNLADHLEELSERLGPGDVVVTLGAGNIGQWAYHLADKLRAASQDVVG